MELSSHAFSRCFPQSISRSKATNPLPTFQPRIIYQPPTGLIGLRPFAAAGAHSPAIEHPGGRMVVELVGAFNELTDRMNLLSTSSSRLLFKSLKLCIPLLQALPFLPDGRAPLTRALSVACLLADLQMDAEVISSCILREVLETGAITILEIKKQISTGTAHLLHESLRVKEIPSKVETLDAESSAALRKFCLSYYNLRAVVLELAHKLDMMKHLDHLPRYHQQKFALEVMNIYAPLAHAIGTGTLSLELEDLSFRYLFPYSYLYVDTWLRSYHNDGKQLIDIYKEQVLRSLKMDPLLEDLVYDISVEGRYKSRFSTMKKLLKDGRNPEDVHDILGLRVILDPKPGDGMIERGQGACYRTREVVQSLWREIPARTKDYIARPKANGYESLHMAVDVSNSGTSIPLMEIQIRTTEMDNLAVGGTASHALYKGGLTDPEEAKRLKAIMVAAAELAALRLKDLPSNNREVTMDRRYRVFQLLDKNGDGRISIDELTEVVEELGAEGEDALELMQLLDANSDGSLSSDEFDLFQKQVEFMRTLDDRDDHYRTMLDEKLQIPENNGLMQVYHKALGNQLSVS
ncbi:probable GTP diphosphokinase CRSH, chloroplastic [Aristolochia californica]|uniref:probable GTP diphosphokinase CRSH, chloroplastic n=1 Tax=Aristolochia californica TaxID=171875 RepID=UPI0035DD2E44